MKALSETFGVVSCIAPGEGPKHRHYPIMATRNEAVAAFDQEVDAARFDLSVMRVALVRYTVGKTELLDEWHRGAFTCNLHGEKPVLKTILTASAA